MRKAATTCLLSLICLTCFAQRYEKVPFGDFEKWTIRYIKESALLGGKTQAVYMVAPNDTIRENAPYDYSRTIWSSSNAYAQVMGVTKASVSVTPDKGPSGTCARLETKFATCKAVGVVNVKVLSSGAIFWGRTLEPITGTKNPFSFMDWGIPFTKKPVAVVLDYRAVLPNTGKLVKGNKQIDGYDPEEIMLILQYRWEDSEGNIHAKRVGSAFHHIDRTTDGWVKNFRIPVIYGNAEKNPSYKKYMGLKKGERTLYAVNSKGRSMPIIEEGWAEPSSPVTHAIMSIATGTQESFTGAPGNTMWVDNIRLEY